jgi:hypothetical protein
MGQVSGMEVMEQYYLEYYRTGRRMRFARLRPPSQLHGKWPPPQIIVVSPSTSTQVRVQCWTSMEMPDREHRRCLVWDRPANTFGFGSEPESDLHRLAWRNYRDSLFRLSNQLGRALTCRTPSC